MGVGLKVGNCTRSLGAGGWVTGMARRPSGAHVVVHSRDKVSTGQLVCLSGSSAERLSQVTQTEYTILVATKTVRVNEMRG